ncbi:uncharacterized protein G6M90_00g018430 [Metarhizium brunneum]|uniref:Uncharacterized protein n=1 Tax=Metarhizium brunneum TaxID=500148 RepID=A0A7D5US95_9HYPO
MTSMSGAAPQARSSSSGVRTPLFTRSSFIDDDFATSLCRNRAFQPQWPSSNGGSRIVVLGSVRLGLAAVNMSFLGNPPPNYHTPPFPSLNVNTLQDRTPNRTYTLYRITDVWKFTVLWTLITYIFFHLGAVLVAVFSHGLNKGSWRFLWAVPIIYLLIAGIEAIIAGSIVGLV